MLRLYSTPFESNAIVISSAARNLFFAPSAIFAAASPTLTSLPRRGGIAENPATMNHVSNSKVGDAQAIQFEIAAITHDVV
jgi:hypothetical protein